MKHAIKAFAPLSSAILTLALGGVAFAEMTEPVLGNAVNVTATPNGVGKGQRPGTNTTSIVYDDLSSPVGVGIGSADPAAQWGDRLFTTGTGVLSVHKLTVFNGSPSAGPLLTATLGVSFYNFATNALLGSYSTNVDFGAGLTTSHAATVTVTGLDPLLINLNVTDILVVQTVLASTGPATYLGVALYNPGAVGSSPATMFVHASNWFGGVPGLYSLSPNFDSNPGYQIGVAVPTVGIEVSTWSQVKGLYRR